MVALPTGSVKPYDAATTGAQCHRERSEAESKDLEDRPKRFLHSLRSVGMTGRFTTSDSRR